MRGQKPTMQVKLAEQEKAKQIKLKIADEVLIDTVVTMGLDMNTEKKQYLIEAISNNMDIILTQLPKHSSVFEKEACSYAQVLAALQDKEKTCNCDDCQQKQYANIKNNKNLDILKYLSQYCIQNDTPVKIESAKNPKDDFLIQSSFHYLNSGFDSKDYQNIELIYQETGEFSYDAIARNPDNRGKFENHIRTKVTDILGEEAIPIYIKKGSIAVGVKHSNSQNRSNEALKKILKENSESLIFCNSSPPEIDICPLIKCCQLEESYFVPKFNKEWDNEPNNSDVRGKILDKKQKYYFPKGWKGYGLEVLKRYSKDNQDWIQMDGREGEWIVLFHGTRKGEFAKGIIENGFRTGDRNLYKGKPCRFYEIPIPIGTYLSDQVKVAEEYTQFITSGQKKFKVVFQCRVDPKNVYSPLQQPLYYIVEKSRYIRPYRVLILEEKATSI